MQDLEELEYLPPHLLAIVSNAVRDNRSLLNDSSLPMWLHNVLDEGGEHLSLRWAARLTDAGVALLVTDGWAQQASWQYSQTQLP